MEYPRLTPITISGNNGTKVEISPLHSYIRWDYDHELPTPLSILHYSMVTSRLCSVRPQGGVKGTRQANYNIYTYDYAPILQKRTL